MAIVAILGYFVLFLIQPQTWFPDVVTNAARAVQGLARSLIIRTLNTVGIQSTTEWRAGAYFLLIAGIMPMLVSRLIGRKPRDVGWQRPNRFAIRYFILSLVISIPFLYWMVKSPTIAAPYLSQLQRAGVVGFCLYYVVNMLTEHLLLHGVVLGLSTPQGRWPVVAPPGQLDRGIRGLLGWLGFTGAGAQTRSVSGWLGLPPGCIMPMLLSALLFGGVHLGKDTRELILSFPGGLAQAYVAFRSNSWVTPFVIHLATAGTALGMMLWFR